MPAGSLCYRVRFKGGTPICRLGQNIKSMMEVFVGKRARTTQTATTFSTGPYCFCCFYATIKFYNLLCPAVSRRFFDGTFEGRRLTCRAFFRSKDEHPRYMTLHRLHSMALMYLRAEDIWHDEASRVPLTRGEISAHLEEFLVREDDIKSSHASVAGFKYVKLLQPNPLARAGSPQRKGVGMTIEINTAARNGCVITIKFTPGAWRKTRGKWRPVELSA
jgi:hypothetical protein